MRPNFVPTEMLFKFIRAYLCSLFFMEKTWKVKKHFHTEKSFKFGSAAFPRGKAEKWTKFSTILYKRISIFFHVEGRRIGFLQNMRKICQQNKFSAKLLLKTSPPTPKAQKKKKKTQKPEMVFSGIEKKLVHFFTFPREKAATSNMELSVWQKIFSTFHAFSVKKGSTNMPLKYIYVNIRLNATYLLINHRFYLCMKHFKIFESFQLVQA